MINRDKPDRNLLEYHLKNGQPEFSKHLVITHCALNVVGSPLLYVHESHPIFLMIRTHGKKLGIDLNCFPDSMVIVNNQKLYKLSQPFFDTCCDHLTRLIQASAV
jgi:hypothetical protein